MLNLCILFEDERSSLIAQLLRVYYPGTDNVMLDYSCGNGNIEYYVGQYLNKPDFAVCCYLDVVPDNKVSLRIYKNLKSLAEISEGRLIVIPIVCAEYSFLRSLISSKQPVFLNSTRIESLLLKEPYTISPPLPKGGNMKNYEQYCKNILSQEVAACCHIRARGPVNLKFRVYNDVNCRCLRPFLMCSDLSIEHKAKLLAEFYPGILLAKAYGNNVKRIWDCLMNISRSCDLHYSAWEEDYNRKLKAKSAIK